MSTPTSSAPAAQPGKPEKPKTLWEKVVTSTPVLLTVVATILAGLSSSEMTRAQYYRSLAAQNQSKVSDQWNFFQAKRIRGTGIDMTINVLRPGTGAGKVSLESLQAAAARLPVDFKSAEQGADDLIKAIEAAGGLGPAGERLRQSAERLRAAAQAARAAPDKLGAALSATEAQKSFAHLTAGTIPERGDRSPERRKELEEALKGIDPDVRKSLAYIDPDLLKELNDLNPEIPLALADVNARKTERAMAGRLGKITEEQIHTAIDNAEDKAAEFDTVGKPAGKAYRAIDELIDEQAGLARALHRSAEDVTLAGGALPPGDTKANDVRLAVAAVARTGASLKATADELGHDFKAAQLGFDSRRYEREARYNQAVAGLYELDVRKASIESDRHVTRSKNFFYAMLAAQAGVTIATFSLAVRYRSMLWALATVAGLAALAVAAYVYLKM